MGDLAAITEIENASFAPAGELFDNSRVTYLIVNRRCVTTVAQQSGKLLGWVSGVVWPRGKTPWGRVYALAVSPDARGQRIGSRLLADAIRSMRHRGAGQIFLEVRSDNLAALQLYQSAGFKPCEMLPDYYGRGLPAVRMTLEI